MRPCGRVIIRVTANRRHQATIIRKSVSCNHVNGGSKIRALAVVSLLIAAGMILAPCARSQTAVLNDAWWTFQQDCNGDGSFAGTLPGNLARLNWNPDVSGCDGTLSVFEKVYSKTCASTNWTPIYTNALHSIIGCRSSDAQFLDVPMGPNGTCHEYKIEVYRSGRSTPDDIRSPTNDVDLAQHHEQALADDACLSDFFASAVNLSGATGSHADDNTYATKEPGEPNHAGNAGGKSLWYTWTAPTNTPVSFDTLGSTFDTLLAVYTGNSFANLSVVVSNDDINGATVRQSSVTFTPVTGTTYHIAVDGFGGASGIMELNWNQTGGALPDLIIWGDAASPTVITRTFAKTDCEVVEGCEPVGTRTLLSFTTETRNIGNGDLIMGDPSTNSLFIWATCHQHYHFEHFANYTLLDTNGVTVASGHKVGFCLTDVHSWSPTANPSPKYGCNFQGIQVGWADVYEAGLPCQYIDITGVPSGDYTLQIVVNPDNVLHESNTNNNVTLVPVTIPPVTCTGAPTNDNFANAIVVDSLPFNYTEFNNCATKQSGEPNHLGSSGGHSVWFSWTPASNQTAVINTKRSDFDTVLAVYTGNAVNSLTLVASNDDIVQGVYLQSQVSFAAVAGTTYHIAVDGYYSASETDSAVGTVVLNVDPPGNDDFTNAFALAGVSGTTNGYNFNASKEAYEPAHAYDVGGHSIWYTWVAPATGPVDFNTLGSTFDTTLAVYTNNNPATPNVTNLTVVAANDDDTGGAGLLTSRVGFNATAGITYEIAIDGFAGAGGYTTLNWNMNSQLGIASLPNGQVQVSLTGVDWQRYSILQSSNMLNWTTNPAITMMGGYHVFTFTNTNGVPVKFFKSTLTN